MFRLNVNDDVNVTTKETVERLVSNSLTLNKCRHKCLYHISYGG